MNFQYKTMLEPLNVLVINPLVTASRLLIVKIMSGVVFGSDQIINLNLLVKSNEIKSAKVFKLEIESCAFSCTGFIKISSDLPSVTDGDVFIFMTGFSNPNVLKFNEEESTDKFNALYPIVKLASSLSWSDYERSKENLPSKITSTKNKDIKLKASFDSRKKPILIADGLIAMDVLKSFSKNMPADAFYCPTSITPIAKSVLGDYLNVHCNVINDVLVWAANDDVFHIEVEEPLIKHDEIEETQCDMEVIGKGFLESLNLDSTQFSASWLKKEFIKKVASSACKNPYGGIYRAVGLSRTLRDIWLTRTRQDTKVYSNMGIISDGSLQTIAGLPYVLPIIFEQGSWSVNKRFENDFHLQQEIRRINEEVQLRHKQLMTYCKKLLQDNQVSADEESNM